jgi:hypothetical protein
VRVIGVAAPKESFQARIRLPHTALVAMLAQLRLIVFVAAGSTAAVVLAVDIAAAAEVDVAAEHAVAVPVRADAAARKA